jgi:hypothetical protein
MKIKLLRKLTPLLLLGFLPLLTGAQWISPPEGFSISYLVNDSDLVFTGEVVSLQFIFRANVPPQWTTDVTMKVSQMIKGEPNAGKILVKFMIPGGERVNPRTGELEYCRVTTAPQFKTGEKVMMFLRKHPHLDKRPIPYGGLIAGFEGKRERVDDTVSVPYTFKDKRFYNGKWNEVDSVREILLPIDLALQIAKAALKDPQATTAIEEPFREVAKRAPIGRTKPKPDKALLDSIDVAVNKILIQE